MRSITTFLLLLSLHFTFSQTQYLTTEPNHSTIGFEIDIAGGASKVTGKFMEFDLQLEYVDKDWTKSKVLFIIQAKSITTGIPDRDDHLRTADFFEVEKYPEIRFESSEIRMIAENSYEAKGIFSMHGISEERSLPFEVVHEEGNTLGIKLETSVNRITHQVGHTFEHTAIENFLADEVDVRIYFWTRRDKRKS